MASPDTLAPKRSGRKGDAKKRKRMCTRETGSLTTMAATVLIPGMQSSVPEIARDIETKFGVEINQNSLREILRRQDRFRKVGRNMYTQLPPPDPRKQGQ